MNCCVVPAAMEVFAGVTAIDTSTGAVTVSVVEPVILLSAAVIVEAPVFTAFAKPPAAIVATLGADEPHVAVLVRFCVLPSLYVPVAVNCCVLPTTIEAFAGVTAMDTSAGGATVRVVEPHTEPAHALTVALPTARA